LPERIRRASVDRLARTCHREHEREDDTGDQGDRRPAARIVDPGRGERGGSTDGAPDAMPDAAQR
jgi:hypothetical protein